MSLSATQHATLRARIRGDIRCDEPMARHTTMQVGGPVDAWVQPADVEDVAACLQVAQDLNLPWAAVGRGSNLLVRDGGLCGIALHLGKLDVLRADDATTLYAEAGVRLKRLLGFCAEQGLSGVEGLEGVPGTVGGALIMNAGTPAGAIGDAVIDVTYLDKTGAPVTRTAQQLAFAYRKAKIPRQAVVVSTRLRVQPAPPDAVRARLAELRAQREKAQPGTQPAVGSVFRNPEGRSAWRLIDEAGLRGVRIGKARVSELHANWIINEGGATAREVETLIHLMREQVKERCGILLDPEVIMIGEERRA